MYTVGLLLIFIVFLSRVSTLTRDIDITWFQLLRWIAYVEFGGLRCVALFVEIGLNAEALLLGAQCSCPPPGPCRVVGVVRGK